MRIAVLAHHRHPLRAPFMGGLEAYTHALCLALMARGHQLTVLAPEGSDPALPLLPGMGPPTDTMFTQTAQSGGQDAAALNAHVDAAFARLGAVLRGGRFDIVHNNSLHRYPPRLARTLRLPMLTSLHVPPFDALHRAVQDGAGPWCGFTVTSQAQSRVWWPAGAPPTAWTVPNGIELGRWPVGAGGGSSGGGSSGGGSSGGLVWAGRIAPNKGTHLAAAAARLAGLPLTICGPVEDAGYVQARLAPLLGGGITLAGHLPHDRLAQALGRADAALFTPLWNEPFGLAALEALACGTPVAALGSGAAAEVIGAAGAVVPMRFLHAAAELRSDEEPPLIAALAAAIHRARSVPRSTARRQAEGFAHGRMMDQLERIYAQLIAARDAPAPELRFPTIELDCG